MSAMQAGPSGSTLLGRQSRLRISCSAAPAVCPKLVQKARVLALVGSSWQLQQVQPHQPSHTVETLKQKLKFGINWMGAVVPAAAVAQSQASATAEIYAAIAKALDIYVLVLTLRVILTWFRNINWTSDPFFTLRQFTDPFLNTFRGILPSFGGIDVSPMIGFFLLNFVRNQLVHLSRTLILS